MHVWKTELLAAWLSFAALCSAQASQWIDVPFVKQPQEGCGAASIAMVMQYWNQRLGRSNGNAADVAHIQNLLFSSEGHGIYASDLQRYFEHNRFKAYAFEGDQTMLAHHIALGRPLIVGLKPTSNSSLHFVVVSGIDQDQHLVLVNDPAQRKLLKVRARDFEYEWKATGNWTLLAVPEPEKF